MNDVKTSATTRSATVGRRETRFRRGHSGNPAGKSPGRKNLKTELLEELSHKVAVSENGKRRLMSRQTIILKRLVADASKLEAWNQTPDELASPSDR